LLRLKKVLKKKVILKWREVMVKKFLIGIILFFPVAVQVAQKKESYKEPALLAVVLKEMRAEKERIRQLQKDQKQKPRIFFNGFGKNKNKLKFAAPAAKPVMSSPAENFAQTYPVQKEVIEQYFKSFELKKRFTKKRRIVRYPTDEKLEGFAEKLFYDIYHRYNEGLTNGEHFDFQRYIANLNKDLFRNKSYVDESEEIKKELRETWDIVTKDLIRKLTEAGVMTLSQLRKAINREKAFGRGIDNEELQSEFYEKPEEAGGFEGFFLEESF
jgi:hypothetical protein